MKIKCIAFDCFGTLFDMTGVSRDEIKAYVEHVRKDDFTPFEFPQSWWTAKSASRRCVGDSRLLRLRDTSVGRSAMDRSNCCRILQSETSSNWDGIVELAKHRVYKPHVDAYATVECETGF
jgi:hypothetical protein